MSANLSHAAQGFVNCVVVGKDIVPRLSVVNIGRLIDELVRMSFIHAFIHPFVHSFIHSFVRSFIHYTCFSPPGSGMYSPECLSIGSPVLAAGIPTTIVTPWQ